MQKALADSQPGLEAVTSVRVNLDEKLVVVTLGEDDQRDDATVAAIVRRLGRLGYRALPPRLSQSGAVRTAYERRQMIDVGIAGAGFGNVMLFATSVYFGDLWGMSSTLERFFNVASACLAGLVLLTAGRTFFSTAWSACRERRMHIDLPIAAALLLAYVVSIWHLFVGSSVVYFDSVTGLVFLLLVGRYVSDRLQSRARRLAGSAASLVPESGRRLKPGDEALVRVGDVFPADGVVREGVSEVSEAALTGEQSPVLKQAGSMVYAGTHNLTGSLSIQVTQSSEASYVASIARLVDAAKQHRSRFETAAEHWLSWFIGGIFVVATVAAVVWSVRDPSRVVEVVVATLIVSCPCALALATPLTMAAALQRAWKHGIIVKSSEAIERAASIDTIVLDKTGTLTSGAMRITGSASAPLMPSVAVLIAAAAEQSRHPVARALSRHLKHETEGLGRDHFDLGMAVQVPGRGLQVDGVWLEGGDRSVTVTIGTPGFVFGSEATVQLPTRPVGATSSVVAVRALMRDAEGGEDVRHDALFELEDSLDPFAAREIEAWRRSGLDVHLLSGDGQSAVLHVAAVCGIAAEKSVFGVMPADKAAYVQELVDSGRHVLMVGDGVNDAAALASATVGVAVSGGVDLALASADAFLGRPGITPVAEFLAFARYTVTSLKMTLGLSALYNLVAVALAVSGVLHPVVAAAIMPVASISVITLSALRRGEFLWKSYSSSCRLPLRSPASP